MRGRIKKGASVMQDFCFFKWPGPYGIRGLHIEFDIRFITEDRVKCIAEGFGVIGSYGNGAVFVDECAVEVAEFRHIGAGI